MLILARLSDEGQNYIEFDIACGEIQEVRPSLLAGWKGTKVKYSIGLKYETEKMEPGEKQTLSLTTNLGEGGSLYITLHKGYSLTLKYPIIEVGGK